MPTKAIALHGISMYILLFFLTAGEFRSQMCNWLALWRIPVNHILQLQKPLYLYQNKSGGGVGRDDTQKQNKKPNTTKNNPKKPNQKPKPKTPQKTEATCSAPGKYFQLGCIMIYNLSSVCYWQSWAVEKEELNQQLGPLRRLTLSLSFSFPYISYFIFSYFIYFHIILETKM